MKVTSEMSTNYLATAIFLQGKGTSLLLGDTNKRLALITKSDLECYILGIRS